MEEGGGWFAAGEYFYSVGQGDLFLTRPGEALQGSASGDSEYRLYYFGFHLTQLPSLQRPFLNLEEVRVALDPEGKIRSLCDSILDEMRSGAEYSREMHKD